jgi:CMP-N-acetylneuraminic acid synthetase
MAEMLFWLALFQKDGGVMKVVAFVPVKLNSVRVPGKNIKLLFGGTPLIHLVQRSLLSVPELFEIYCYCSNQVICDYLLEGITFLERPVWLDTDSARGNDLIKTFVETVNADLYLMAHATSPFVKPQTYSQAIQNMQLMLRKKAIISQVKSRR